jgi:hypothetical protein
LYIGGGLGGLVLFGDLAKDSFEAVIHDMRAVFITAIVISGATIGFGYFHYHFAHISLKDYKKATSLPNETDIPDEQKFAYPLIGFVSSWIAIFSMLAAALCLIFAAWQPGCILAPSETKRVEIDPTQLAQIEQTKRVEIDPTQLAQIEQTKRVEIDPTQLAQIEQTKQVEIDPTQLAQIEQTKQVEIDPTQLAQIEQWVLTLIPGSEGHGK